MGERNSPDAGETALAAATAAIITARWAPRAASTHAGNGHDTNGHGYGQNGGGLTDPPASALGAATFDELPPVSPAPPISPAPYASPVSPAATYFSAVAPDVVPEVFDARAQAAGAAREAVRDLGPGRDEFRTQVPPGFERRNFGPFPQEPEQPPADGGWALPDTRAGVRTDEPRAQDPVPSPLLGVLPTASQPMPASFAPPEPAPWTDSGWVDFPRDLEAEPSMLAGVAAAGGRAALPRRTPRIPDLDYPLFDRDPAEPDPDPVTQRLELNRIADFLRDDMASAGVRPDAVDLEAVLGAVRAVPDVKDAQLRWNAQAGHTLRIEFADGVDESEVTRSVVRLLRANLGLAAQPSVEEPTVDSPFRARVPSARAPRPGVSPTVAAGRPLPVASTMGTPRLVVENVSVTRLGAEATVEVRLRQPGSGATVVGEEHGPGVEAYLSRLAANAAARAVDRALTGWGAPRGKVFVEHVSVVAFGVVEVAVIVLLLSYDGVTEQLSGSAIVGDDPHVAVVRATLAALNRRLESLLS